MTDILPTLFISHGSPETVITDAPAANFLRTLGNQVPRPAAILCVSAHWETTVPTISCVEQPETIHDFHGFRPELYEITYPAPGAPVLASVV